MRGRRRWPLALRALKLLRPLGRLLGRGGKISVAPPPLSAWTASRDLPLPPRETFRERWTREEGGK
jgi:L-lactate dehydrogenase complex protein LldF